MGKKPLLLRFNLCCQMTNSCPRFNNLSSRLNNFAHGLLNLYSRFSIVFGVRHPLLNFVSRFLTTQTAPQHPP